jgi:hypothetical protein
MISLLMTIADEAFVPTGSKPSIVKLYRRQSKSTETQFDKMKGKVEGECVLKTGIAGFPPSARLRSSSTRSVPDPLSMSMEQGTCASPSVATADMSGRKNPDGCRNSSSALGIADTTKAAKAAKMTGFRNSEPTTRQLRCTNSLQLDFCIVFRDSYTRRWSRFRRPSSISSKPAMSLLLICLSASKR